MKFHLVSDVDLAVTPNGRPADDSPLAKPGYKGKRKLSDYEREIARALMREGKPESLAIAIARGMLNRAAKTGKWGRHGAKAGVATRAGAAASLAQRKTFGLANPAFPAGAGRDIELGKFGSKWKHDYVPLNPAAVALKNHKQPRLAAGTTVKAPEALKPKSKLLPSGHPFMPTTHRTEQRNPDTYLARTDVVPATGTGGLSMSVDHHIGEKIAASHERVVGFKRGKSRAGHVLTTQDAEGVVRRYKGDGSNVDKPTIVKPAKLEKLKPVNGWQPGEAPAGADTSKILGGTYRKGNKTVIFERKHPEAHKAAFLGHLDEAFDATKGETGHPITVHVPSGDSLFRGRTLGYVHRGDSTRVHVSPKLVKESGETPDKIGSYSVDNGWWTAGQGNVHSTVGVLTHELGHIVDNKHSHTAGNGKGTLNLAPEGYGSRRGLTAVGATSRYGRTNAHEGYAEAFAHYHLARKGDSMRTRNPGHDARAAEYAKQYGWTRQNFGAAPGQKDYSAMTSQQLGELAANGDDDAKLFLQERQRAEKERKGGGAR